MSDVNSFFFSLTPEKILDAVEQFGVRCTGRSLQLNSLENRVFELEIEIDENAVISPSDRFRVVKFYRPNRWSKEQIQEEHDFLLELDAAGVSVAPPLRTSAGKTLLEVPGTNIYFSAFRKIGGRLPQELNDEQLVIVGRLLARLHLVGASSQSKVRPRLSPKNYAEAGLHRLLECPLLPPELTESYRSMCNSIIQMTAPWFETTSSLRLHGDCHFGNILWSENGPRLVDFDDMRVGPAIQDIWLLLPGRDKEAGRQLEVLLGGYEQLRLFNREEIRLIEPLRAYRMIHYAAWVAERWHDPAFPRAFPQFGTQEYWRILLGDLKEQLEVIQNTGFGVT